MSRCFPFPPPGYERKARIDDVDLLKKEKHKEKKHKKEKKDKEKREGKEKREKDRSDEKHREKKEKKEKHRDKKKDKEKDKERDKSKDRSGALEEKILSGPTEFRGGEKLVQKERRDKDKGNSVDKRFPGQFAGYKAEKPNYSDEGNKDSKLLQELGRRIKDEAQGIGNQFENFSTSDPKKDEGMVRLLGKGAGTLAEVKEKNKDRRVEDKATVDGQRVKDEAKVSGNTMVQNIAGNIQTNFGGMPKPLDKNVDRKLEGKEKAKDKHGENKRGDKRKDKEKEKKSKKKDKERDKEKKKEEKAKEKIKIKDAEKIQLQNMEKIQLQNTEKIQLQNTEKIPLKNIEQIQLKSTEPDKLIESNKDDLIGFNSTKTSQLSKDSNRTVGTEGNLKKRKDLEANGVLHANDIKPNKLPRPASSSQPCGENGRILNPHQKSIVHASDRQGAAHNVKLDNKEHKINGIIDARPSLVSPMKHTSATVQADPIAEESLRQPHPDSKYLDIVYSVPKMEEWSDFDDQEWLISSNDSQLKKAKVESSAVEEAPQVWAEALQMELADIYALPYVIPY